MQWFGIYMYCELIATIALLNNYHHTSLCIFFLVMRTFKTQILKKILRVIFFFFFWVSVCPPSFCLLSRLSRNSVVCPEEIQFSLLCSPWSDCISGCQFILTIASGVTFEWISNNNRLLTKLQATACCSVAKSCLTLWHPMDCSTPGFPALHYLPEPAQTHVHRVGDAIQPFRPLSFPSPLPSIFPSIRVFSNGSALRIR